MSADDTYRITRADRSYLPFKTKLYRGLEMKLYKRRCILAIARIKHDDKQKPHLTLERRCARRASLSASQSTPLL